MALLYYVKKDKGKSKINKFVYIKSINLHDGTLEFTENKEEAYQAKGGYYAEPTRLQIATLFAEDYPEVKKLKVCD